MPNSQERRLPQPDPNQISESSLDQEFVVFKSELIEPGFDTSTLPVDQNSEVLPDYALITETDDSIKSKPKHDKSPKPRWVFDRTVKKLIRGIQEIEAEPTPEEQAYLNKLSSEAKKLKEVLTNNENAQDLELSKKNIYGLFAVCSISLVPGLLSINEYIANRIDPMNAAPSIIASLSCLFIIGNLGDRITSSQQKIRYKDCKENEKNILGYGELLGLIKPGDNTTARQLMIAMRAVDSPKEDEIERQQKIEIAKINAEIKADAEEADRLHRLAQKDQKAKDHQAHLEKLKSIALSENSPFEE